MNEEQAAAGAVLGAVAGVGGAVGAAVGALFAAEGTLGKLMGGPSSQKFEVNPDNILQAGKVIYNQHEVLMTAYEKAFGKLRVPQIGDKVNDAIADAWNSRLVDDQDSYAARIEQYLESLRNLCNQLRTAATQYGFSEDEVKTALGAPRANS